MKITIVLIPLLLCLISQAQATDYCDPDLCDAGETHVACDNDGSFDERCPADAQLLEVDQAAQEAFVEHHNEVRNLWAEGEGDIDVRACRMATVSWDKELASLAEFNVKQCQMEHDECHNTKVYRNSGQNLFYTGYKGGSPPDLMTIIKKAVDSWASEGKSITAEQLASYPENDEDPVIGHFTMVAQERNTRVGCAVSNYTRNDGFVIFLVACNYATTNFIGEPVYRACEYVGEECETGRNPLFPNLCSIDEDIEFN